MATNILASKTSDVTQTRQRLDKSLKLYGYSACREALVLLVDHYATSSDKYDSIEDFICKLHRVMTFDIKSGDCIISPDQADQATKKLRNHFTPAEVVEIDRLEQELEQHDQANLTVRLNNVEYQITGDAHLNRKSSGNPASTPVAGHYRSDGHNANEFNIHYNFLFKRLNSLPIFKDEHQLYRLDKLTASTQPNIRCICFGLLVKDISKIDGYILVDSSGRVPLRMTPDTVFRNRLAYTNCIVLVEGVYLNPDDVLYAAHIGLPPILLDPIKSKTLACRDENMIVILRELFMDDDDVCRYVDMLFTGYNSMEDPPLMFIMIGDFTRSMYATTEVYRKHTKKLVRFIRTCDNLKKCHFIFVPGQRDAPQMIEGEPQENLSMPKPPLTKQQMPIQLLQLSGFENVHLATNPTHVYVGERQISIVSHSYIKEIRQNLLHDLSDHREEQFEAAKQIILSNAHLSAGISRNYHSSMNLWHKPDLLVLADTVATGRSYDYSVGKTNDTSFTTTFSFSQQFSQFKVYYLKTGEIEDSQVSQDAMEQIIDENNSDGEASGNDSIRLVDDSPK